MKRRRLLQGLLAAPLVWPLTGLRAAGLRPESGRQVVVVGAGAFGGWTALRLAQAGARVTLIERWTPGHLLSSSGGDTRVIRHMYANPLYVRMAARSLAMYQQADEQWRQRLLHRIGVLFLGQSTGAAFFEAGQAALDAVGIAHHKLSATGVAERWSQLGMEGIEQAVFEPQAGYLEARRACQAVHAAFRAAGGRYIQAQAVPGPLRAQRLGSIRLDDNTAIEADDFVFACGPWLPKLFPEVFGAASDAPLSVTRQDVYYFDTPPGESSHTETALPVWADFGERLWYGIPGTGTRGFKVADDTHGDIIEPESTPRSVRPEHVELARDTLRRRFPALADAPLQGVQLCQYTNSPDGDFIVDQHPEASNLWLVGGGSGHGFKHGPALGELVAESVLEGVPAEPAFALSRSGNPRSGSG